MGKPPKKLSNKSSRKDIDAFIRKAASMPAVKSGSQRGRLIFAMDATASREPTWDRACYIQAEMFEQTANLGGLEIQLCYYRGYNEFHATNWLAHSEDLLKMMSAVRCLGGYTQLQKVLQHAVKETKQQKVNALVFVGDCVEEDVDRLCQIAGELGIHQVPVFAFHEGYDQHAEQVFRQIARLTMGSYCAFDANSAQQLRDLLSAVAIYAVGGRRALQNFSRHKGGVVKLLTQQLEKKLR